MKQRINFWDKVKQVFRIGILETTTKEIKDSEGKIHKLNETIIKNKFNDK